LEWVRSRYSSRILVLGDWDFPLGGTTGYAINPASDFGPIDASTFTDNRRRVLLNWSYALGSDFGPIAGAGFGSWSIYGRWSLSVFSKRTFSKW